MNIHTHTHTHTHKTHKKIKVIIVNVYDSLNENEVQKMWINMISRDLAKIIGINQNEEKFIAHMP